MANRLPGVLVLGSALVAAACGGEGLTLPPEGEAAHIEVISGLPQSGTVNTFLAESLVVLVTDTRGREVPDATVNVVFPDANGSAEPATVTTNADGIAWSKVKLGTTVGPITGKFQVPVAPGVTPVEASFTVSALAANALRIARISGNEQAAPAGSALQAPLVVEVSDEFGNPISGITVNWTEEDDGSVSAASTVTGDNGQTSVTRTLGTTAGPQSTSASADGVAGSPVVFSHTATAGSAARVEIVDGNGQTGPPGAELDDPLIVRVLDGANNPVVNVAVEWVVARGDGSSNPQSSRTDGDGRASTRWTLGSAPGTNTLNAVVSGVGRAEFTATAERIQSDLSITADNPDPSIVSQPVEVSVAVTGGGPTPTGSVTVNGEGAASPCTITLAGGSGSCSISFTQPGSRQITATYSGDASYQGDTDTESHQVSPVVPQNNPPTAAFTPPTGCTAGQACQFNDASTDSDGSVASWSWTFGDPASGGSNTSTEKNPSHTFATAGDYSVALTVTDDDGAPNSVTHTVTVGAAPPQNTAPVAVNDSYTTPQNTVLTVGFPGLLANDTDAEQPGTTLITVKDSDPSVGFLTEFDTDGSFNYDPQTATPGTVVTFTYHVQDSQGATSPSATVTITITAP